MRLRDLFTGGLTWRELSNLVRGLSPGSATRTAMSDGTPEPNGEQIILADVFDAVSLLDWHYVTANSDPKKPKPKKPKKYPRWWENQKPKDKPERVARLEDARRRKREREQAIAEGRIA
ncbi:hypothetical protein ACFV0Y_16785 [Streptomyces sp. NPDC059569]|uniref:hypothetical protein n=1 Tax=Streptomyces sp. NPDC059569 TaxID=3346869 RepID=UPI00368CCA3A